MIPMRDPRALPAPASYVMNFAKDLLREFVPAHIRFLRAGEASLHSGEREVHQLQRLVEKDTIAIDVGAHIGDYTYPLCQWVGNRGHVVAIEPIPDLARMLQRAVSHLELPVTVYCCALSSARGEADLFIPVRNGQRLAGFATLQPRVSKGLSRRVTLLRLDDLPVPSGRRISFIKIDVEGHEFEVLRGALRVLREHTPNLLVEIEQRHSAVPMQQTFDLLSSLGYTGEFLDATGNLRPLSFFDPDQHQKLVNREPESFYVSNFIFRVSGSAT